MAAFWKLLKTAVAGVILSALFSIFTSSAIKAYESQEIDGIVTYGSIAPLRQWELDQLITELNQNPATMDEQGRYITLFADYSTYSQFPVDNGESLQQFSLRTAGEVIRMSLAANPSPITQMVIRRLIITDGHIGAPVSYHRGWLTNNLADSDGTWYYLGRYTPRISGYFDHNTQVDVGLIHEWGHVIFQLNDQYALDVHPHQIDANLFPLLGNWNWYGNSMRTSTRNELMAAVRPVWGEFTALQIQRRTQKHNFAVNFLDYLGWPVEFPQEVELVPILQGQPLNFRQVNVYAVKSTNMSLNLEQTSLKRWMFNRQPMSDLENRPGKKTSPKSKWSEKKLLSNPIAVLKPHDLKRLNPATLFSTDPVEGIIGTENATLLFLFYGQKGETYPYWIDSRFFNVAHWRYPNQSVQMLLPVPGPTDNPNHFGLDITYQVKSKSRTH